LQQAREDGYLDATSRDNRAIVKAHGLWCWRLRLPMVWFERLSPYSRFVHLRLDMLTTPNTLTGAGQSALKALGDGRITAHDALWERIPRARAAKMAHAVLRAAIQVDHYRLNRTSVAPRAVAPRSINTRRDKPLKLVPRKRASA
jgi:hypothetical protein